MGMYGGGGSPPPPPDYSAEKAAIIDATLKDYQAKADAWNTQVSGVNSQLEGFATGLNNLKSGVGSLTVNDVWDNPNTAENENLLAGYQSQLSGGLSNFQTLNLTDKPVFDSVIQSQYGPLTITGMPTLNDYNMGMANNLKQGAADLQATIDQLNADRRAAENQVRSDYNSALSNFGGLQGSVANATIASDLGALSTQYYNANNAFNTFNTNPIASQLYDTTNIANTLSGLNTKIGDLQTQRSNELSNIANFEKGLMSSADEYYDTLGGLTIASETGINDLQRQIDALQRKSSAFSSVLPYDLSQENQYINDLEGQLRTLQNQRKAELDRISTTGTQLTNTSRNLTNALNSASIYDKAYLDNLKGQISNLQSDISGFSSVLPFDFGNQSLAATSANTALTDLYNKRGTALRNISNSFADVGSNLGDIPLYNESGIKAQYRPLEQAGNMLDLFTGNDVDPIRYQILEKSNLIDNRLQELYSYRDQLEQNARVLMQKVKNNTYYTLDDVTNAQAAGSDFASMQDEVDLYQAQQAMDEIQAMVAKLTEEKQRLEQDAANVAARDTSARGNLVIGAGGVPQFTNFSLIDPITMEQYINSYIYNNQNKDDVQYATSAAPSSFANALGVIQVGG